MNCLYSSLIREVVANYYGVSKQLVDVPGRKIHWAGNRDGPPLDTPPCGFDNSLCPDNSKFISPHRINYWRVVQTSWNFEIISSVRLANGSVEMREEVGGKEKMSCFPLFHHTPAVLHPTGSITFGTRFDGQIMNWLLDLDEPSRERRRTYPSTLNEALITEKESKVYPQTCRSITKRLLDRGLSSRSKHHLPRRSRTANARK